MWPLVRPRVLSRCHRRAIRDRADPNARPSNHGDTGQLQHVFTSSRWRSQVPMTHLLVKWLKAMYECVRARFSMRTYMSLANCSSNGDISRESDHIIRGTLNYSLHSLQSMTCHAIRSGQKSPWERTAPYGLYVRQNRVAELFNL